MNPSKAMLTLCQRFLEQHQGKERAELLDQIVYDIKSRTEIGTPCPATANKLSRKICTLLTSAGKLEIVREWYQEATQADLAKETLEEMASCCSSIYMSKKMRN